ncbi:Ig-like domain-containing protein [Listeria sp. PSOL-1]|uniref:Ig-like domain-containing protein n=1 Tax=Listeria sp. PSOL-1 TaxID=1844999 RepID=UPI0013D80DFA|nr:Ig-like domain-containing protein [Listeria sp. PSOL-1]
MKKGFTLFLTMILTLAMILLPDVSAKAATDYGSEFFNMVSLQNNAGKETNTFKKTDRVKVSYNWAINQQVHSGETMTLQLPEQLKLANSTPFSLQDENGNVVATVTPDQATGKVTITFTDFVETHTNIHGTLFFWTTFDQTKIKLDQENKISLPVNGGYDVKNVLIKNTNSNGGNGQNPTLVHKSGRIDSKNPYLINWTVTVNNALVEIDNAYLVDTLGAGHKLINPVHIKYRNANKKTISEKDETVTVNNQAFQLHLGTLIDQSVVITYQTKIDGNHFSYRNNATLHSDNIKPESRNATVNDYIHGGHGRGESHPSPPLAAEPATHSHDEDQNEDVPGLSAAEAIITGEEPPTDTVIEDDQKIYYYTVHKGDTLNIIAQAFKTTTTQIVKWNHLNTEKVYVGQKLIVRIEPILPQTGDSSDTGILFAGFALLGLSGWFFRRF